MKHVFVGSSSHAGGESYARVVLDHLAGIDPDHIKPLYWRDAFPLSIVTFDALQQMLSTCSGAVLVATPEIEGQPNENVMLEFGLIAGRMGPKNVALCKHPDAKVPSDLGSMTFIELRSAADGSPMVLSDSAVDRLRRWVLDLPETMEGVSPTRLVHGYTGRWCIEVKFDRLRRIPIAADNVATLDGNFDLNIPLDGRHGFGLAISKIEWRVRDPNFEGAPYEAEYRACAEISDVECLPGGEMRLRSYTFARQCIRRIGTPPREEGWADDEVAPWHFNWHMVPNLSDNSFTVTVEADSTEWTSGKGILRRLIGPI